MRTLRHAAALLAAAQSIDTLLPVVAELGFDPVAMPLDATTRAALGIPDQAGETRLVRGRGALRALLIATDGTEPLRTLYLGALLLLWFAILGLLGQRAWVAAR